MNRDPAGEKLRAELFNFVISCTMISRRFNKISVLQTLLYVYFVYPRILTLDYLARVDDPSLTSLTGMRS